MTEDIAKWEDRHPESMDIAPVQQDNSPASMMMMAMSKGMDPDKLDRMLDLQQKWESNEARKSYFDAVASFKENPPEVLKDKENPQFKSKYTSLGNLLKTVNPALGKQGLSVSFEINQDDKLVMVSCLLSHRQGHTEKVTMTAPPDTSGGNSKNPIQQIKSTITYLRAATFEAVTGLAATDANLDDDGNGSGKQPEYISVKQFEEISKGIEDKNIPIDPYLGLLSRFAKTNIETVDQIPASAYNEAIRIIKKAKGQAKNKEPKTIPCPEEYEGKDVPVTKCETECEMRKDCPSWS